MRWRTKRMTETSRHLEGYLPGESGEEEQQDLYAQPLGLCFLFLSQHFLVSGVSCLFTGFRIFFFKKSFSVCPQMSGLKWSFCPSFPSGRDCGTCHFNSSVLGYFLGFWNATKQIRIKPSRINNQAWTASHLLYFMEQPGHCRFNLASQVTWEHVLGQRWTQRERPSDFRAESSMGLGRTPDYLPNPVTNLTSVRVLDQSFGKDTVQPV